MPEVGKETGGKVCYLFILFISGLLASVVVEESPVEIDEGQLIGSSWELECISAQEPRH